jgi:hypothetical protein
VCLPRQYRAFAAVANGRHSHRFFDRLITRGFATTDLVASAHAGRIYHLQYKPWYRLLGEPDHRHRRAMSVGRAVERLMVLDGVLAEANTSWLGLSRDKVAAFTDAPGCVPTAAPPRTTVGGVVRAFQDPFPIGPSPDGTWLFLYLVAAPFPEPARGAAVGTAILASPLARSARTFCCPRRVHAHGPSGARTRRIWRRREVSPAPAATENERDVHRRPPPWREGR